MPYCGFSFRENLSEQPLKNGLIMEGCKGQVITKEVKRRGDVFNTRILIQPFYRKAKIAFYVIDIKTFWNPT